MEFVDGPTVSDLVDRGGAMDEARAVEIVLQVSQALDHAHRNALVHRDVKPQNIIIATGGVAKLCDLGLAQSRIQGESGRGQVCGTPDFISPEQVRGVAEVDIRSDIYSLGVTTYYMLVGDVPFHGETTSATMAMHLTHRVDDPATHRPGVSKTTSRIVHTMTAKDPRDRYNDPAALIADLRILASELMLRDSPSPGAAALRSPSAHRSGGRSARRRRRR
jgi:serine/threonine-protein kinase